jgi:ribosomal protein S24E
LDVKILEERPNPLMHRKEYTFEVDHAGAATPPRADIRKELAKLVKVPADRLVIERMNARFGTAKTVGEAMAYATKEAVDVTVREHILIRNGLREKAVPATPAAGGEAPAPAAPKEEPKAAPPKTESAKEEAPQEHAKPEHPKPEHPKAEHPKAEGHKPEPPKEGHKGEGHKGEKAGHEEKGEHGKTAEHDDKAEKSPKHDDKAKSAHEPKKKE